MENVISRSTTAILCMDYQNDIVSSIVAGTETMLDRANKVLDFCRQNKVVVIYVVIQFRQGYPEISIHNKQFSGAAKSGRFVQGSRGAKIHESVRPQDGDLVVTKKRVSAFVGSDLEVILRARQIKKLVLFGVATGGVVLSTLRQAADLDYQCLVLEDLCTDQDGEIHKSLVSKIFPRQAEVVTSLEFMSCVFGE